MNFDLNKWLSKMETVDSDHYSYEQREFWFEFWLGLKLNWKILLEIEKEKNESMLYLLYINTKTKKQFLSTIPSQFKMRYLIFSGNEKLWLVYIWLLTRLSKVFLPRYKKSVKPISPVFAPASSLFPEW